jgi:hypothetical protein
VLALDGPEISDAAADVGADVLGDVVGKFSGLGKLEAAVGHRFDGRPAIA